MVGYTASLGHFCPLSVLYENAGIMSIDFRQMKNSLNSPRNHGSIDIPWAEAPRGAPYRKEENGHGDMDGTFAYSGQAFGLPGGNQIGRAHV